MSADHDGANERSGFGLAFARAADDVVIREAENLFRSRQRVFFLAQLDGEVQQGMGLLIQPTTNNADYVIYFVNPSDKTFRRTTGAPDSATVIAEYITNTVVFSAQDHLGTVLTNNQNNRVIHLNLEFYQAHRHLQVAQYYRLETSVTRRAE